MIPKKICVVGPCLNMGGIERASSTIANQFAEQGHDVLYLAIFKHPRFFKLHPQVVYDEPLDGTNVTKLNLLKTILRIRKTVTKFNPDSILAFNKLYAALTLIAVIGLGKKVYISERSSPFYKWRRQMDLVNRFAFTINPPDGVIAQTNIAAEYQKRKLPKNTKITVIPNAVRNITLHPEIARKNWILAVGRLDDNLKGFDRLIDAFTLCETSNWQLVFAGALETAGLLQQQAERLGLTDRIVFLGKIENMDEVYAQASIFVIPSRSEGFPNALCEAMAAGLPCISFDFTAGPRDIISNGVNGIIVPDGDLQQLATAIDAIASDAGKRAELGKNASEIATRLESSKIGKAYFDFISQ